MDGWNWYHQITGHLSIYTYPKPRRYHSWQLRYLLATIPPVLKKYSKCERIFGYNFSFMIEKGPFLEWIAATGGESTQYLWKQRWLQVLTLEKDSTHENNRSRQVAPWNNGGTTQMHGCMCSFEVTIRLKWKYLSKHCLYTIHGCKCCSEINTVSYKEWMTATNFVKKKKYCTLEKIVKH